MREVLETTDSDGNVNLVVLVDQLQYIQRHGEKLAVKVKGVGDELALEFPDANAAIDALRHVARFLEGRTDDGVAP